MLHSLYTKKRESAALLVGKHKIVPGQVPYVDVVKQLPPNFPQQGSADPLIKLSEQAAHEFIRIRKEAIDEAAEMLKQNEHRQEVLSILEYLAKNGHFTSLSLNQKRRIK